MNEALAPPRHTSTDAPETGGDRGDVALVLSGGGARAAYQLGLLRCIARHRPDFRFPIITGVSAGAINAAYLAAHPEALGRSAIELAELWSGLETEEIFRVDASSLARQVAGWMGRLTTGGAVRSPMRGLVDTAPLRALLERELAAVDGEVVGIARNLEAGLLKAFALTTVNYATGQTLTWIQGRGLDTWERPHRRSRETRVTVEHVMASAALPLFFPAVRLGDAYYGDGGIRLAAPLSPARHLGARRILAVSTRYRRDFDEADLPVVSGYPPPAQILGNLLNAIFLDVLDQDVNRLERVNQLLAYVPEEERRRLGLDPIDIVVLRPSEDLGRLSAEYEARLPRAFRFLTRGLGTRQTKSPDFLSLVMFQPDYLQHLIALGERDAEARGDEILALLESPVGSSSQRGTGSSSSPSSPRRG